MDAMDEEVFVDELKGILEQFTDIMPAFNQSNSSEILDDNLDPALAIHSLVIPALVVNIILSTVMGLVGAVTNVINLVVYYHQGLNSSINISFFCMALSDLFRIVFIQWSNVCFNPYIDSMRAPVVFDEVFYVTGGWAAGLASRITLHITVFITAERCLCILFPLKIKAMITPRRSTIIVVLIYCLNSLTIIPEYTSVYLAWMYKKELNATLLGAAFRSSRSQTKGLSFLLHVVLVIIGLCSVIVLTSVLVTYLRRQTRWRQKNSCKRLESNGPGDRKTVVLVSVVATCVVISYIPVAAVSLVTVFLPDFYVGGQYSAQFKNTWSVVFLFGTINSSTTICIYYAMNSKYKNTVKKLFCKSSVLNFLG